MAVRHQCDAVFRCLWNADGGDDGDDGDGGDDSDDGDDGDGGDYGDDGDDSDDDEEEEDCVKFGSRPLNKRVKTKGEDQENNREKKKKKKIAWSLGAAPSTRELRPKGKIKRATWTRRRILLVVWEPPPQQES